MSFPVNQDHVDVLFQFLTLNAILNLRFVSQRMNTLIQDFVVRLLSNSHLPIVVNSAKLLFEIPIWLNVENVFAIANMDIVVRTAAKRFTSCPPKSGNRLTGVKRRRRQHKDSNNQQQNIINQFPCVKSLHINYRDNNNTVANCRLMLQEWFPCANVLNLYLECAVQKITLPKQLDFMTISGSGYVQNIEATSIRAITTTNPSIVATILKQNLQVCQSIQKLHFMPDNNKIQPLAVFDFQLPSLTSLDIDNLSACFMPTQSSTQSFLFPALKHLRSIGGSAHMQQFIQDHCNTNVIESLGLSSMTKEPTPKDFVYDIQLPRVKTLFLTELSFFESSIDINTQQLILPLNMSSMLRSGNIENVFINIVGPATSSDIISLAKDFPIKNLEINQYHQQHQTLCLGHLLSNIHPTMQSLTCNPCSISSNDDVVLQGFQRAKQLHSLKLHFVNIFTMLEFRDLFQTHIVNYVPNWTICGNVIVFNKELLERRTVFIEFHRVMSYSELMAQFANILALLPSELVCVDKFANFVLLSSNNTKSFDLNLLFLFATANVVSFSNTLANDL